MPPSRSRVLSSTRPIAYPPNTSVVFAAESPRLPNTSCFALPGRRAETLLIALDLAGVALSSGAACSSGKVAPSHVLAAMGVPETLARCALRLSFGWSSRRADLDRCLAALAAREAVRAARMEAVPA